MLKNPPFGGYSAYFVDIAFNSFYNNGMKNKGEIAKEYFERGYTCSQAVVLAFKDEIGVDETVLAKLVGGLGGGVARKREVCGTVTGLTITLSYLYGDALMDVKTKSELYADIQSVINKFEQANGSIVCKNLLGLAKTENSPVAEPRTKEYYKKRPCGLLCHDAALLVQEFIDSHELVKKS